MAAAHSGPVSAAPASPRSLYPRHNTLLAALLLSLALLVSACADRTAGAPAETVMTGVESSDKAPSTLPDFSVAGLKPDEVRLFLQALQTAVGRDDRARVATLVSYPIKVRLMGQPVSLDTPAAFMDHYSDIMNGRVKRAVTQAKFDELFVNYQGIRLGRGELWCAGVYEKGQQTYRIRIIAINN